MKVDIGEAQSGRALLKFHGSPGIKILANPDAGKSVLIETMCREAKRQLPNLRIIIISTTGKFDYELLDFEFYSSIRHEAEMFAVLEELNIQANKTISRMEELACKDVRKIPNHIPVLLVVDELESVEDSFDDKKKLNQFAKAITLRINQGRKLEQWTVVATQSQDLAATVTRTRAISTIILGRPQSIQICRSLCIDEKFYLDHKLSRGRLLLIADGNVEIIKVRKES